MVRHFVCITSFPPCNCSTDERTNVSKFRVVNYTSHSCGVCVLSRSVQIQHAFRVANCFPGDVSFLAKWITHPSKGITRPQQEFHRVPVVAQWVKNLTSIHEEVGSIPGLTQWVKDLMIP